MSGFSSMHPRVRELLLREGIIEPTVAQSRSIHHILERRHTLVIAPTGIGKTECAAIPIFDHLLRLKEGSAHTPGFKAIYTTPLRALNRDIISRLESWGKALDITVGLRHGDTSQSERNRQSRIPPDFLITTPETLQILFTGSRLVRHLEEVRFVVVDEIHDICPNVRGAQLSVVLERLEKISNHCVTRIGLSATVGFDSIVYVANFLGGMGRKVTVVNVHEENDSIMEVVAPENSLEDKKLTSELACSEKELASIITSLRLIKEKQPLLFFVNTRQTAEVLASRIAMLDPNLPLGIHHGSLSKEVRMKMEDDFKKGELKGLICTSSLELGIDVGFVEHVVQFSSPREVTRLVQRIGRAGHGVGRISHGTILATRPDDILESGVIVRKALAGEMERINIPANSLAVLSNQIMAACMIKGKGTVSVDARDFFNTVKRAMPFSNLKADTYYTLLRELDEMRMIRYDPILKKISRKKRTMDYFYNNISMIRDEKVFKVIDMVSRRPIGTLNEGFVVTSLEPGVKFIVKGRPWVVVEIERDSIMVAPSTDIGAIPSWTGEDIPVPFGVAQEVGRIRREIHSVLAFCGKERELRAMTIKKKYRLGENAWQRYLSYVEEQVRENTLPTSEVITIERYGETTVINTCFGTRTNDTFALIISSLAASRLGRGIETTTDAYRIVLSIPRTYSAKEIKNLLYAIPPEDVIGLLELLVKNSTLAKWTLLYVAKKFGAIKKDADMKYINTEYLIKSFRDTLIHREAVGCVLRDYLDVKNTKRVLEGIRAGDISVVLGGNLSPMAMEGLEARSSLIMPSRADSTVLKALKERLMRYPAVFVCLHCNSFAHKQLDKIPERKPMRCSNCGGTYLAMLREYELDLLQMLRKDRKKLNPDEEKKLKRLNINASLISQYKKRGALAMMGRGIGPVRAARILAMPFYLEEEFLREILTAEIEYAQTRRFWD
ncbi:MAG: DEAD/DEAH box helicase [Candidatus Thermoplasmatota archaeon]|nr:DEAD/DEAH box helicase [Candidatus Thermoplasmatota archaeon]